MSKQLLILFSLLLFYTHPNYAQQISRDDNLRSIIERDGQAEVTIPAPGRTETDRISRNVSISSLKDKTLHIVLSPQTMEWFVMQSFDYKIIEKDAAKGMVTSGSLKDAMEWESYPSFSQYDSIMRSFASTYPSLCVLDTIGKSINGKLILVLKITDNVLVDEDEPEVFYSSSIHGDETGGFILMLRLADYLLKNYSVNPRVKQLVDNLEIWINPLSNPDGTYRSGNTIVSPVRANANGYDLNRNFPDPITPNTIKQKETLNMISFMRKHNFVLSANFHSGEEVVNYPWDRWSRLHADDQWFYKISRKYADTVHHYSVPGYMTFLNNGVTNGYQWYQIYGGRQDYITYELQGREVTIELDDIFITPASQLNSLWNYNWHSLIGYLENALYGIHGSISDFYSSEPVTARIFIMGHDKDSSHVYSDTLSGSFVRFTDSGSWDLLFTARGYRDTLITDIIVTDGEKTIINVLMMPDSISGTQSLDVPLLYPNPVSSDMNIVLPSDISGTVNIIVYNLSGIKIAEYNTISNIGVPIPYDVSHLAAGVYYMVITNNTTKISYTSKFIVLKE